MDGNAFLGAGLCLARKVSITAIAASLVKAKLKLGKQPFPGHGMNMIRAPQGQRDA